jgi:hypothetical protein
MIVHMLPWRSILSETDVPGTYSTNHGVNQVRELCTPVVLVDIFHFSEICEQAPSLSHPEVDESRFFNLPIGSTAHPPWVGVGLSRKIPLCLCWDSNPGLPARSQ